MAITFSLSAKADNKGRSEVLIRYKSGVYSARAKSGVYSDPSWFDYVKGDSSETPLKGKKVVTGLMQDMRAYHTDQKIKLSEISSLISDTLKNTSTDRSNSKWLLDCIDRYYQRGEYTPIVEQKPQTLFQFIADFIDTAHTRKDKKSGRLMSYSNVQCYKATEKRLLDFAERTGKKDFEFSELDQDFYDRFVAYLQSKITTVKNGKEVVIKDHFTQNTVGKHVRVLKAMLNDAQSKGVCNILGLSSIFYVYKEDTDTIYLNDDELQKLKDADFSEMPHLDRVRDWFLLLTWTGCRFSDLSKITKTDIKNGFITFRQKKTNNKVTIPLHPVVVEVLEKYNYDLPTEISNQKFNEYIKTACQVAKINSPEKRTRTVGGKLTTETFEKWELVTSHTGRRSFCTNMYKRGLPSLMIMSVSGHTTESAFLKYIKVKQEEHAELMAKKWAEMYGANKTSKKRQSKKSNKFS